MVNLKDATIMRGTGDSHLLNLEDLFILILLNEYGKLTYFPKCILLSDQD